MHRVVEAVAPGMAQGRPRAVTPARDTERGYDCAVVDVTETAANIKIVARHRQGVNAASRPVPAIMAQGGPDAGDEIETRYRDRRNRRADIGLMELAADEQAVAGQRQGADAAADAVATVAAQGRPGAGAGVEAGDPVGGDAPGRGEVSAHVQVRAGHGQRRDRPVHSGALHAERRPGGVAPAPDVVRHEGGADVDQRERARCVQLLPGGGQGQHQIAGAVSATTAQCGPDAVVPPCDVARGNRRPGTDLGEAARDVQAVGQDQQCLYAHIPPGRAATAQARPPVRAPARELPDEGRNATGIGRREEASHVQVVSGHRHRRDQAVDAVAAAGAQGRPDAGRQVDARDVVGGDRRSADVGLRKGATHEENAAGQGKGVDVAADAIATRAADRRPGAGVRIDSGDTASRNQGASHVGLHEGATDVQAVGGGRQGAHGATDAVAAVGTQGRPGAGAGVEAGDPVCAHRCRPDVGVKEDAAHEERVARDGQGVDDVVHAVAFGAAQGRPGAVRRVEPNDPVGGHATAGAELAAQVELPGRSDSEGVHRAVATASEIEAVFPARIRIACSALGQEARRAILAQHHVVAGRVQAAVEILRQDQSAVAIQDTGQSPAGSGLHGVGCPRLRGDHAGIVGIAGSLSVRPAQECGPARRDPGRFAGGRARRQGAGLGGNGGDQAGSRTTQQCQDCDQQHSWRQPAGGTRGVERGGVLHGVLRAFRPTLGPGAKAGIPLRGDIGICRRIG